jgi:hypothetical protein
VSDLRALWTSACARISIAPKHAALIAHPQRRPRANVLSRNLDDGKSIRRFRKRYKDL